MQIAILVVLILILLVLAPWMFGVILALAAAYGVWLVAAAVVAAGFVALLFFGASIADWVRRPKRRSIDSIAKESNKRYREKEAAAGNPEPEDIDMPAPVPSNQIHCVNCNFSVDRNSLCCSACGKHPRRYEP